MHVKIYGVADKAWQVVVGCDPHMSCAPRCWARRTVARIVECQQPQTPKRAAFYQIALTPDGQQWSGKAYLDEAHLGDPLRWRKPALIATGFHGDWGRLADEDKDQILCVMARGKQHVFLPLTKQPDSVAAWLWRKHGHFAYEYEHAPACSVSTLLPLDNVNLGCSVMNQTEADKFLPHMRAIAAMGWKTHVWYEPALGPVNWKGWEFVKWVIVGGESGAEARPFVDNWAYCALDWCRQNHIAFWMKQMGSNPVDSLGKMRGTMFLKTDRKGSKIESLPRLLRVREYPASSNMLDEEKA